MKKGLFFLAIIATFSFIEKSQATRGVSFATEHFKHSKKSMSTPARTVSRHYSKHIKRDFSLSDHINETGREIAGTCYMHTTILSESHKALVGYDALSIKKQPVAAWSAEVPLKLLIFCDGSKSDAYSDLHHRLSHLGLSFFRHASKRMESQKENMDGPTLNAELRKYFQPDIWVVSSNADFGVLKDVARILKWQGLLLLKDENNQVAEAFHINPRRNSKGGFLPDGMVMREGLPKSTVRYGLESPDQLVAEWEKHNHLETLTKCPL